MKKCHSVINGLIQRSTSLLMIHQLIVQEIAVTAKRRYANTLWDDLSITQNKVSDNIITIMIK